MTTNGHPGGNGRRVMGLEALNLPRVTDYVTVDGYEADFRVQELTYQERISAIPNDASADAAKASKLTIPRIVALGWIGEDGKRVIENPLVGGGEAVAGLTSRAVMAMYTRISDISAFGAEANEGLGKDSKATLSVSGGSPSASSS